ncbi:hypothetical protein KSP40_PGU020300 [Platanthera guangdongensis]|uniref:Expansin-like EG45 domain-containing protein n=1 Tax=Platanthera guangdongensis TaxID=2320717 RepID=A0ABR2LCQ0_9ASPA
MASWWRWLTGRGDLEYARRICFSYLTTSQSTNPLLVLPYELPAAAPPGRRLPPLLRCRRRHRLFLRPAIPPHKLLRQRHVGVSRGCVFRRGGAAIWDNGGACGRQYEVRCLSSDTPGACVSGDVIVMVTVVDQAARLGSQQSAAAATMSLSETAFRQIASLDAPAINIEYAVL